MVFSRSKVVYWLEFSSSQLDKVGGVLRVGRAQMMFLRLAKDGVARRSKGEFKKPFAFFFFSIYMLILFFWFCNELN